MNTAFYNGISGVKARQFGIDTLANNIANINTVAFKGSTPEFADLFSESLNTANKNNPTANDLGNGVRANGSKLDMGQGSFIVTDNVFDLAINGDGWFGIHRGDQKYFTRNGNFYINDDGFLVDREGGFVSGQNGENILDGKVTRKIDRMQMKNPGEMGQVFLPRELEYPAQPTKNVGLKGNIDSREYERIFNIEIITAQNEKRILHLEIRKQEKQPEVGSTWDIEAKILNSEKTEIFEEQKGVLSFDQRGALADNSLPILNNEGAELKVDAGSGFDGLISLESDTIGTSVSKDGFIAGELLSYSTNSDGAILASFSNGRDTTVAQLPLYHFQNDEGLAKIGSNYMTETSNSGEPIFFQGADGGYKLGAQIAKYRLEASNVSPTVALSQLIVMQRAFDANSKSITTGDQLIQNALQMKR